MIPGRASFPCRAPAICAVVPDFVEGEEVDGVIVVDGARAVQAFAELGGLAAQHSRQSAA